MAGVDLGKQVGPLPLGAWIVVVGGGLGIAYWSYTRGSGPPTVVDDTSSPSGVGDGSVGGFTPTTPGSTGDAGGSVDTGIVTTNEAWAVRSINWLIAQGYDATESDSAIRKYIAGNDPQPSIKEYVLQGMALARFGSPPSPLPPPLTPGPTIPPPVSVPPPVVTPPTPVPPPSAPSPSTARWYTVKAWPLKGSSLWSIATIYYGSGAQWPRIFNANKKGVRRADGTLGMITNPDVVYTGWRLQIP
jgi:hypothetical protein